MKNPKQATSVVYQNSEVEQILATELISIEKEVKTNAHDLSAKNLPRKEDKLATYIAKIRAPFQSLLEKIHKKMGALGVKGEINSAEQNYGKEQETLTKTLDDIGQDLRLAKKREKELQGNLGHEIRHWRIALTCLFALTFSEVLINFKIFLPISTNNATAFVGALGIGISLFIICHVFKDILNLFRSRRTKIIAGASIIGMVTLLLYSFARMRLSMITDLSETSAQHVSEWNFVLLNLILFLSGVALTVIYKPSKQVISEYRQHRRLAKQIKALQTDYNAADKRLAVLTQEKNNTLDALRGILLMAHHYERVVVSEYYRVFALWCFEGVIARKDDVSPQCFSETPKPLKTYFEEMDIENI